MPAADRGPRCCRPASYQPGRTGPSASAAARWEGRPGRGDLNGTGIKRQTQAEAETSRDESDGQGQGCGEGAVGQNLQGGGRHRGGSSGQDAGGVPPNQDLLLPLAGHERRFRSGHQAREEDHGWSGAGGVQDGRPVRRPAGAQRAARLPAQGGPGQLQDPGAVPAGGDRHHVPQRLHPGGSCRPGQVPVQRGPGPVREIPLSRCSTCCSTCCSTMNNPTEQ